VIWTSFIPSPLLDTWRRTALTGRLAVGVLAILAFTLLWDQLAGVFEPRVRWPLTGLVAAAGWARLGLSVRPMVVLVVIGFAFDAVSGAPFGVYPLVFLSTYALMATASLVMGGEMDPLTGAVLPYIGMAVGFFVLWVFASIIVSAPIDPLPLVWGWLASSALFLLFEGLFDLQSFKTTATGG